jgi:hypothetical protein
MEAARMENTRVEIYMRAHRRHTVWPGRRFAKNDHRDTRTSLGPSLLLCSILPGSRALLTGQARDHRGKLLHLVVGHDSIGKTVALTPLVEEIDDLLIRTNGKRRHLQDLLD